MTAAYIVIAWIAKIFFHRENDHDLGQCHRNRCVLSRGSTAINALDMNSFVRCTQKRNGVCHGAESLSADSVGWPPKIAQSNPRLPFGDSCCYNARANCRFMRLVPLTAFQKRRKPTTMQVRCKLSGQEVCWKSGDVVVAKDVFVPGVG